MNSGMHSKAQEGLILLLYVLPSLYSLIWIDDPMKSERLLFYAYFALPFTLIFLSISFAAPMIWLKFRGLYQAGLVLVVLSHLWGHLLWFNAVTGSKRLVYTGVLASDHHLRTLPMSYQRGGFGMPYRLRW